MVATFATGIVGPIGTSDDTQRSYSPFVLGGFTISARSPCRLPITKGPGYPEAAALLPGPALPRP